MSAERENTQGPKTQIKEVMIKKRVRAYEIQVGQVIADPIYQHETLEVVAVSHKEGKGYLVTFRRLDGSKLTRNLHHSDCFTLTTLQK